MEHIRPKVTVFFPLWLCLLAAIAGGCSPAGHREEGTRETLVVGVETDPLNLDPRLSTDALSARIAQLVYSSLLTLNERMELIPDAAERWEQPDPTTYIFHLRRGVAFHDGTELTAEDVVHTFRSMMAPALASPKRASFDKVAKVETVDRYTVLFSLSEPFAPFLTNVVVGIVPRHVDQGSATFSRHPVGSGPFRFSSWIQGERLELVAHDAYFGGRPHISRLIFKIIPDATVRLLALEQGSIDLLQNNIPPDLLARLERNPGLVVRKAQGTNYTYLGMNLRAPPFNDILVRQAVAHAIDREPLIRHILKGLGTPASGLLPSSHWACAPDLPTYPYDPKSAIALLERAGYRDPDGPGDKPRFTVTFKTSQNEITRRIGEVLQQEFSRVGIGLEIESYEWGTLFADIKAGNFQLYALTWVGITEPDIYYHVFHSDSTPPRGANRGAYSNPEVDALLELGRTTLDQAERRDIYRRVQHILAQEIPYISLWHATNVVAMHKRVHGYVLYPAGDFRSLKDVEILDSPE
jgi:peptide/nickel transport system substrate-binding protein